MGQLKKHLPAKAFTGIMFQDEGRLNFVFDRLQKLFGPIEDKSEVFNVDDFTDYYQKEMGNELTRRFLTFERLIEPDRLPEVKRWTDELESKQKDGDGNRKVNCDPGYISLGHLILATNKKYSHRPYLRDGVYANLTLIYKKKSFQPLEWTYPDYGSAEIIEIMNRLRERYKLQMG